MLDATVLAVLEAEGSATFVTKGPEGPHLVATWQSYLDAVDATTLVFPAGGYRVTETNLSHDPSVQMIIGRQRSAEGPAIGFRLSGTAEVQSGQALHERMKVKHPWCRGAVVMRVTKVERILG
ncbi:pyridoxamine 5'-phosphate oxidase family protein [Geothrix mesophila]|uniref:pyridoxamine 5'-phosphate oxidase family protein n=1 Tax=Geothrix mesophila TaxID=2922723 RepID=UPI001FADE4CD|nr:pyridoxamine 5'-phosphate oxidase family protein [Geothrix sp. SG198]